MKIGEVIQHLEYVVPPEYKEDYDNVGLIVGEPLRECTGVLVSLDCTQEVIKEAIRKNCNLVVSHHPLIFRGIKNIRAENETGRTLMAAIHSGISVYAMHTNLDNMLAGVNSTIADRLDMVNRRILLPFVNNVELGSGMIGDLPEPLPENDLLALLRTKFNVQVIRHSPLRGMPVHRIAICGGSGSFLIPNALANGADFFVTADVKYHDFFGGEGQMVIADIGHFESEQFTVDLISEVILKKFSNFAVLKSDTETNPVKYYI